jgi:hypothetical protein
MLCIRADNVAAEVTEELLDLSINRRAVLEMGCR